MKKDELIELYQDIVSKKEQEVNDIVIEKYNTNCTFRYNDNSSVVNLHTCDEKQLLNILAWLIGQRNNFAEACELTGSTQEFLHGGFSFENWLADIKTNITKINVFKKKQVISNVKVELSKLESQETKEAKLLASIEKTLASL